MKKQTRRKFAPAWTMGENKRKGLARILYPAQGLVFALKMKNLIMPSKKKWSARVTKYSDALDLEKGVFAGNDPKKIAQSLKSSAIHSHRRKGSPFQSAMSMINFYINRGGKNLSESKKKVLENAKNELRHVFSKGNKK